MGLQSQLNDVSSDSLPFLLLALLATAVAHLRSFCSSLLPSSTTTTVSHTLSSPFTAEDIHNDHTDDDDNDNDNNDDKCVFCLSGLREGDRVRKLTCRHVFHTDCLDGWIGQMKFSCPLCRSPLPSHWKRVDRPCRRVVSHLSSWFAVR